MFRYSKTYSNVCLFLSHVQRLCMPTSPVLNFATFDLQEGWILQSVGRWALLPTARLLQQRAHITRVAFGHQYAPGCAMAQLQRRVVLMPKPGPCSIATPSFSLHLFIGIFSFTESRMVPPDLQTSLCGSSEPVPGQDRPNKQLALRFCFLSLPFTCGTRWTAVPSVI